VSKRVFPVQNFTDEHFIAKLGLVSVQSRLDSQQSSSKRWTSQFTVNAIPYHLDGFAADFGRPRGIDTDTQIAIETLFHLQGCPNDDTLTVSAYELREACLMTDKGTNYLKLRESLMRLWRVGFIVQKAHYQPESPWGLYLNETLSLIARIRFWSAGARKASRELDELMPAGKLVIQLSEPYAQSIRAGFTHTLNRELLASLEQPTARALYRLQQAHRPEDGRPLRVALTDWATACGITSTETDKIRRVLGAAHEELQANNYLDSIEVEGRGSAQVLNYHFRTAGSADPSLVRLLRDVGVSAVRAEQLAAAHPKQVELAVRYVQQRQKINQIRNPGGLVADILTNPDKYVLPEAAVAPVPVCVSSQRRPFEEEAKAEEAYRQRHQMLLQLEPQVQWEESKATLKLLLKSALSAQQFERLAERCQSGQVMAAELASDLSRAAAQNHKEEVLKDLIELLRD